MAGMKELVEDKKTGILFEAENINDLTDKITYLLQNPQIRNELGKNARKNVMSSRKWLDISKKYLEIYSDLVN